MILNTPTRAEPIKPQINLIQFFIHHLLFLFITTHWVKSRIVKAGPRAGVLLISRRKTAGRRLYIFALSDKQFPSSQRLNWISIK